MQLQNEPSRIPTLDGWRGVAILLVLVNHALFYSRFKNLFFAQQGRTAVDIFFVISGYIITARLLDEGNQLNLTAFYRRRAFRILPPVFVYLFILIAFAVFGFVHNVVPSELLGSLFFFRNFQLRGAYTGHLWSLAIEEQFYLLWPALLAFLRPRRALYAASIGALACAIWRHHCLAAAEASGQSLYYVSLRTDCRFDGLLIGCCMAILTTTPSARAWIRRIVPKETPFLCGFPAILLLSHSRGLPSIWFYFLTAIAIAATLFAEQGLAYKWLNLPALAWIGRISYGLYVYQQIFLLHPLEATSVPLWQTVPFNLLGTLTVATASFYFIERPLIRMAQRRGSGRLSEVSDSRSIPNFDNDNALPAISATGPESVYPISPRL